MSSRERRSRRADLKRKGEAAFERALRKEDHGNTWEVRNALAEAARTKRDQERQAAGENKQYQAVGLIDSSPDLVTMDSDTTNSEHGDFVGTPMTGRRANFMLDSWRMDGDQARIIRNTWFYP